jgi:hypothetical protein
VGLPGEKTEGSYNVGEKTSYWVRYKNNRHALDVSATVTAK